MYKTINYCDNLLDYLEALFGFYLVPGILLVWAMASLAARNPKVQAQSNAPKAGFFKQCLWVIIAMFGGMFVIEKSLHEEFKRHRIAQKAIAVWAVIVGLVTFLMDGDNTSLRNAYETAINGNTMEIYSGDIQLRAFPSYEIYKILSGIHSCLSLLAVAAYIWYFRASPTSVWFKTRKFLGLEILYFTYTLLIVVYTPFDLMMFAIFLVLSILLLIDYRRKGKKEQSIIEPDSSRTILGTDKTAEDNRATIYQADSRLDNSIDENEIIGKTATMDNLENQLDKKPQRGKSFLQRCKVIVDKMSKGVFVKKSKESKKESAITLKSKGKRIVRWSIGVIIALLALFLIGLMYAVYIFPKQCNRIDAQMIDTAMNDSSKTIEIAEWFLSTNSRHWEHGNIIISLYDYWGLYESCDINHKEVGEKILKESAESGHADAQFIYGMRFFETEGWVHRRYAGNLDAPRQLFRIFESAWNGEEIDLEHELAYYVKVPTFERAAYWLKKSVDNGHADAAAYLGFFYELGLGVKEDLLYSESLTRTAAERKSIYGMYRLGIEYSKGTIVKKVHFEENGDKTVELFRIAPNINEAKRLWKIAADAGYERARVKYEKIYED